jgi:hypothetical protein
MSMDEWISFVRPCIDVFGNACMTSSSTRGDLLGTVTWLLASFVGSTSPTWLYVLPGDRRRPATQLARIIVDIFS